MREVVTDIDRWRAQGDAIALATVIQTWGSAPRGVGAKMALTPASQIAGSVSGGCVEGAVVEAGAEVLKTGRPQLLHFGVADETAWSVGLACGGSIEVFVKPLDASLYGMIHQALAEDRSAAMVTVVRGPADLVGREMIIREDGSHAGSLPAAEVGKLMISASLRLVPYVSQSTVGRRFRKRPSASFMAMRVIHVPKAASPRNMSRPVKARTYVSCTTSSASASLRRMLRAMRNSRRL